MKKTKSFPFHRARRLTAEEVEMFRLAIERKLGVKRPPRGRPEKPATEKYKAISIKLHPLALEWAKKEAKEEVLVIKRLSMKFCWKKPRLSF